MTQTYAGGCRCGAVRYRIGVEPLDVRLCHCRDCQYSSGSAFAAIAYFPKVQVEMMGKTHSYACKGSAGLTVERHFCPECGTPLYSQLAELPDLVFVKVGSLDDPNRVQPRGHMWCNSMVSWLKLADTWERLPGNPDL